MVFWLFLHNEYTKDFTDLDGRIVDVERVSGPVSCFTGNFSNRESAEKRGLEKLEYEGNGYEADYYELVALRTQFTTFWINQTYRAMATGIFYRYKSD